MVSLYCSAQYQLQPQNLKSKPEILNCIQSILNLLIYFYFPMTLQYESKYFIKAKSTPLFYNTSFFPALNNI